MAVSSEVPCVHFSVQKGHRVMTSQTSGGNQTAPAQTPVGLRAAMQLPYSYQAVDVPFMLSFAFNHLLKADISNELLRIFNNNFQRERENQKADTLKAAGVCQLQI